MYFESHVAPKLRSVRLAARSTLVLDDARTGGISVDYGSVWITLQDDRRDIVLLPGMRFEIDRGGRTVVTAEEDSRLRISRSATWAERALAVLANLQAEFRRGAPVEAAAQKPPLDPSFTSTCGGQRPIVRHYY